MRFKEFLNETASNRELEYSEIVQLIKTDCAPFLEMSKGYPLLRGIKPEPASYFYTEQPVKRRAVDSDAGFNVFFNLGYQAAYGTQNVRTLSFFASGSETIAKAYGKTYYIFPKGDFHFTFGEDIKDSWMSYTLFCTDLINKIRDIEEFETGTLYAISRLFRIASADISDNAKFESEEVDNALSAAFTYMFPNADIMSELQLDKFKSAWRGVIEDRYEENMNLTEALDSDLEILFFHGEGYYAIKKDALPPLLSYTDLYRQLTR